jgi:hypothetical protein
MIFLVAARDLSLHRAEVRAMFGLKTRINVPVTGFW